MVAEKRELSRVSDGELDRQHNSLRRLMNGNKFSREKRIKLESEICYLQREMFIRVARKEAHQKYMEEQRSNRRNYRRN